MATVIAWVFRSLSQMVWLGQASWDMCVSGIKSEQASNVYLFTQIGKSILLLEVSVNVFSYSANTYAMISYVKLLVKRSRTILYGCNELKEKIAVVLLTSLLSILCSLFILVMCILLQHISNPRDFVKYISGKMTL